MSLFARHKLSIGGFAVKFTSQRLAIMQACIIGLASAAASVLLQQGVKYMMDLRHQAALIWSPWLALPIIGAAGGLLAGWLVSRIAPETSGSGIPQIKAILAQAKIPLSWRTAVAKLAGGMLALGTGMPLGREGPTVQIGAALAAVLNKWVHTTPEHRRHLIASGAGAGLAAAFNAPIAGVIFVMEELRQGISTLTVGTAVLACFSAGVASRLLGNKSLDIALDVSAYKIALTPQDIPFYVIIGIAAGMLASLFNRGILTSLAINKASGLPLPVRVGLAGLVTGLVVAALPGDFSVFASLREQMVNGQAGWPAACLALISFFVLTQITYGSGAPGGLFAPSLIIGAALGYLVGSASNYLFAIGTPASYALVGMGAFFSGMARVPITAIVIMFEMTADINLVLPLMIGSIAAHLTGEKLFPKGIYDHLVEAQGLNTLTRSHRERGHIKAEDIMSREFIAVDSTASLAQARDLLAAAEVLALPVTENGRLVGVLSATDLFKSITHDSPDTSVADAMRTAQPVEKDAGIETICAMVLDQKTPCLPVVDSDLKLLGVIPVSEVIRALSTNEIS